MSLLLSVEGLSKAFGTKELFENLSFSIFSKDRIGLIGQNGTGKSTLLRILAGLEKADTGVLSPRRGLKIGYLPQSCDFPDKRPLDVLLETFNDYENDRLAKIWMSKLGFTGEEPSAALLSGGWKKRLMLAREMLLSPDLLLLDEPTNHLDLEGILYLEKFLAREAPAYLLVSHDRYFLQHASNRIVEIDPVYPSGLFAIDGSYQNFLAKKEEFLQGQLQQERILASKVKRETQWLRRSPKARTTKSRARIDQAHALFEDFSDVKKRNEQHRADIDFTSSKRETRKLLVAKNLSKEIGGRLLFRALDFTLSPGTRIGLMGPNGSGKTTLLRLLAGEMEPDQGTIKRADALEIVYFDQHRDRLDGNVTLRNALSPNGDFVQYLGESIHVNGWCKRFLFSPDNLNLPLSKLSGGERARIAIARLMLQPADLLLLDEPTNDLDIPTLEILETSLQEFPGAIVLITHDRCMLDRICNSLLPLGDPTRTEPFADYAQWEASLKRASPTPTKEKTIKETPPPPKPALTYKEKKEHEEIEGKILKLEEQTRELTQLLGSPELAQNGEKLTEICTALGLTETQIEQLYLRWEELNSK